MNFYKRKIRREIKHLIQEFYAAKNSVLQEEEIQHLPLPVKKWLQYSGAAGRKTAQIVWLQQSFIMKLKPDQKKWFKAKAGQIINIQQPSFIWWVRLKMAPLLFVLGRDKLAEGIGVMQMNLYGLFNVMKAKGEKIDEGTLQRYLGEIAWAPSAAVSPFIKWKEIDDESAEAVLTYKSKTVSGRFYFSDEGNFLKFETYRYKDNSANSVRYKWVIVAHEHKRLDGVIVPVLLSATWHLNDGPWTWCRIAVDQLKHDVTYEQLKEF